MTITPGASIAIVTSSYRSDFERCRLLCESIDRYVTGHSAHYILVEEADRALFAALEGPRRQIIGERALLPKWLRPVTDPLNRKRRLWLHPYGLPLRGWHVQQLRRIAFGMSMDQAVMLSCDSDVIFIRPFDVGSLTQEGRVRFHRVPGGIDKVIVGLEADHLAWSRTAGQLLGIKAPSETRTGYITTLVAWRADTVRAMARRLESVAGRPALHALAATRSLSECTIYGRFVDEVEGEPSRHAPHSASLARVYWAGEALGQADLATFIAGMDETQVAICLQSFIGTDLALIRSAARLD